MYLERLVLTLTTDASGDAVVYSDKDVAGRVLQMRYVPDGVAGLATGADLTITGETTGVEIATLANIGTSAFTRLPRQATHATDGSTAAFADSGEPVLEPVYIASERIKVVVAEGGAAKTGTLHLVIG